MCPCSGTCGGGTSSARVTPRGGALNEPPPLLSIPVSISVSLELSHTSCTLSSRLLLIQVYSDCLRTSSYSRHTVHYLSVVWWPGRVSKGELAPLLAGPIVSFSSRKLQFTCCTWRSTMESDIWTRLLARNPLSSKACLIFSSKTNMTAPPLCE